MLCGGAKRLTSVFWKAHDVDRAAAICLDAGGVKHLPNKQFDRHLTVP
jgi:hypothetical protein